jgi:hypothetical protein
VEILGDDNLRELFEFPISSQTENFKFGTLGQIMNLGDESVVLKFLKEEGKIHHFCQCVLGQHTISFINRCPKVSTKDAAASQNFSILPTD